MPPQLPANKLPVQGYASGLVAATQSIYAGPFSAPGPTQYEEPAQKTSFDVSKERLIENLTMAVSAAPEFQSIDLARIEEIVTQAVDDSLKKKPAFARDKKEEESEVIVDGTSMAYSAPSIRRFLGVVGEEYQVGDPVYLQPDAASVSLSPSHSGQAPIGSVDSAQPNSTNPDIFDVDVEIYP